MSFIKRSKSIVMYGNPCKFHKKAYSSCICNDILYRSYKIKLLVCFIWAYFLEFQNICRMAEFIQIVSSMCAYVFHMYLYIQIKSSQVHIRPLKLFCVFFSHLNSVFVPEVLVYIQQTVKLNFFIILGRDKTHVVL